MYQYQDYLKILTRKMAKTGKIIKFQKHLSVTT